jgi:hypothetical protein
MSDVLQRSLGTLFSELIDGPGVKGGWMLNSGDAGLLRSLETLTAAAASATPAVGGASIAAHVEHVRYGLSLLNRWGRGERDPWSSADWAASWDRPVVDDEQWAALRHAFEEDARAWLETLRVSRDYAETELNDVIASVAHLAYHLGAIRQIDRSIRGPAAR